tara:strand:- start:215 stop:448 length:234 start_codon:yes stop_codon:yes gene_type:complete
LIEGFIMAIKIDFTKLNELINIQKERQLIMQALSENLGIDISFNDDEVLKFAQEAYANYIETEIISEVDEWMKSVLS